MNGRKKRFIALILMLVMVVFMPLQTLAADSGTEYIKEMQVYSQKDFEDYIQKTVGNDEIKVAELKNCKTWTSDDGFTVLNKDVNAGTGEAAVYIGYKTTHNPKEAITDTAVMDMNGGYSFTQYKDMLENNEKEIGEKVSYLQAAISEYQENYKKNSPGAIFAYEQLNFYVDGDINDKYAGEGVKKDSGQKLGDYFLTNISKEKLVKIIMQSNSAIMSSVYMFLAYACANTKDKSWLELLSTKQPETLPAKDYDEKAADILPVVHQWQSQIKLYGDEAEELPLTSTEEEIADYIKDLDLEEQNDFRISMQMYQILDSYAYGNQTLAQFFSGDNLTKKQIYPLVKILTPGQLAVAFYSGLSVLFQANGLTTENINKAEQKMGSASEKNEELATEILGKKGPVSLYEGIDRKLFFNGVAYTNDKCRAEAYTKDNDNPFYGNLATWYELTTLITCATTTSTSLVILGYLYTTAGQYTKYVGGVVKDTSFIEQLSTSLGNDLKNKVKEQVKDLATWKNNPTTKINVITHAKYSITSAQSVLTVAMYIEWAYTLISMSAYLISEYYAYRNPTMTEKPLVMIDTGKDLTSGSRSTRYDAVMQYSAEGKEIIADLNADKGKEWNVLYTTKDSNAGKPITTECLYYTGKEQGTSLEKYTALHRFGETNAFNLNTHCYSDDDNGIYMFFGNEEQKTNDLDTKATAFGVGNTLAIFIMTAIAGIAVGAIFGYVYGYRKKELIADEEDK